MPRACSAMPIAEEEGEGAEGIEAASGVGLTVLNSSPLLPGPGRLAPSLGRRRGSFAFALPDATLASGSELMGMEEEASVTLLSAPSPKPMSGAVHTSEGIMADITSMMGGQGNSMGSRGAAIASLSLRGSCSVGILSNNKGGGTTSDSMGNVLGSVEGGGESRSGSVLTYRGERRRTDYIDGDLAMASRAAVRSMGGIIVSANMAGENISGNQHLGSSSSRLKQRTTPLEKAISVEGPQQLAQLMGHEGGTLIKTSGANSSNGLGSIATAAGRRHSVALIGTREPLQGMEAAAPFQRSNSLSRQLLDHSAGDLGSNSSQLQHQDDTGEDESFFHLDHLNSAAGLGIISSQITGTADR